MSNHPVLELKNVTMQFGGVKALNNVNIHVNKGEICALIGPNGAGKTTVFNVVTGVYAPTQGEILFNGKTLKSKNRHKITKMGIARTFQNVRLFGEMTSLENVITATDVHNKSGLIGSMFTTPRSRREEKAGREKAHEILKFIGIDHRSDQLAKNLNDPEANGRRPILQVILDKTVAEIAVNEKKLVDNPAVVIVEPTKEELIGEFSPTHAETVNSIQENSDFSPLEKENALIVEEEKLLTQVGIEKKELKSPSFKESFIFMLYSLEQYSVSE